MNGEEILKTSAERIHDTSEEIRYAAVKELSNAKKTEAIPFLARAVADSSYRIREEALRGICSFPPDMVFSQLEVFLRNNEDANLRNAAMEAYPRYGKKATAYLLNLLKDNDEEVRNFSCVMLGEVNDLDSVDELICALSDPDENVCHAAAESLGKIKDPRSVEALLRCLNSEFWVQYPAIVALGCIGDPRATRPIISLLNDEMLKQPVIEALGKIGDLEAIPVLAELLSSKDASIRNDVIGALVKIQTKIEKHLTPDGNVLPSIKKALDNKDLVNHLMNSLKYSDLDIRKNSIIALGWLKESKSVRNLIELLNDYELEEYAIGSLVSIGEGALPELIEAMATPDPKIKVCIIRCIGWIGDPAGIKKCIPFLNDPDSEVRYHALLAMSGAVDCEDVEDALLSMLMDTDPEIKHSLIEIFSKSQSQRLLSKLLPHLSSEDDERKIMAVKILGRAKDIEAFEFLRKLTKDDNDEVRAEAYNALSEIHSGRLTKEMLLSGVSDPSPTVRKAVVADLVKFPGEEVEKKLISMLDDTDPDVRITALETLGKIGSVSSIYGLIEAFADGDRLLKLAIIQAMGNIHDKASTQFLCDLLREADSDLKRAAIYALTKLGDKRSTPEIIVAFDDPDWSVRCAAITALGKIGDKRYVNHIKEKLDDKEDLIKKCAIIALRDMGAAETVNSLMPLIHNENLQLEVIESVEKLGITDMEFFYDFLKRSNTRIRCMLVDVLGRSKKPNALDYLVRIMGDEFFVVRRQAAKALGELGNPAAIPPLLKTQKDDPSEEVRMEAARTLKKLDMNR